MVKVDKGEWDKSKGAEENHNFSSRAVELCLAHSNKNKVEKAYLRSDLFSKRQSIMHEWNKYLIK